MNPKVSIIVPNYNYARFLDMRMESVLSQTYQDFELILLDDASSDDSKIVLEKYKDNPHVTALVINEKNTGNPFMQWRKGIEMARGEYIWIAESDDCADKTLLERAIEQLDKNKNAVLCFFGSHLIDQNGNLMEEDFDDWSKPLFSSVGNADVFDGHFYISHYLIWNNSIYNASGTVFRRDAVTDGVWNECLAYKYCGDWFFWSKMALKGKVIIIRDKLNYFRQHVKSTTVQSANNGRGLVESMQVIKENVKYVSFYKRMVRIGLLYRDAHRNLLRGLENISFNKEYFHLYGYIGGYLAHIMERFNKLFLPVFSWTISMKKDHLKENN